MPRDNDQTHQDILSSFSVDDEDQEQLGFNEEQPDDFDDDEDEQSATGPVDGDDDAGDDDNDDRQINDRQQQQQQQQKQPPKQKKDDREDRFSFKEDKAGNLIDKDGNILVRAGKQRDLFVKLKKTYLAEKQSKAELANRFSEIVQGARQLLERHKSLKAERTYFDDKGLTKDEIKQAADMAVLFKIDPKAAVRKVLTMVHMGGTDLKDIGVTGPVDAAEVARIMEQRVRPKEKTEQEKAQEEAQAFLDRHPQAQRYTGLVAQAKRRYPHMTFDEIWFQLVMHAQQVKQQREGQGNGQQDQRRQPDRVSPRNGIRDRGQTQGKKLSLKSVDPSQSYSQIGRDLLRDLQALEGKT